MCIVYIGSNHFIVNIVVDLCKGISINTVSLYYMHSRSDQLIKYVNFTGAESESCYTAVLKAVEIAVKLL